MNLSLFQFYSYNDRFFYDCNNRRMWPIIEDFENKLLSGAAITIHCRDEPPSARLFIAGRGGALEGL
jgi:hypothetical protein